MLVWALTWGWLGAAVAAPDTTSVADAGGAHDAADPEVRAEPTNRPPAPPAPPPADDGPPRDPALTGRIALVHESMDLGFPLAAVVELSIRFQAGIDAPIESLLRGEGDAWQAQFGSETVTVSRRRASDGAVLTETTREGERSRGARGRRRICAHHPRTDDRPWLVDPLDSRNRVTLPPGDRRLRERQPTLFVDVGEGEHRVLRPQLAPGDSITVVELIEPVRRQPRRFARLERETRSMLITEDDDGTQTVCVEVFDTRARPRTAPAPTGAREASPWGDQPEPSPDEPPDDPAPARDAPVPAIPEAEPE